MPLTHKDSEGGVVCGMHMMYFVDLETLVMWHNHAQPCVAQDSEVQKCEHLRDCVLDLASLRTRPDRTTQKALDFEDFYAMHTPIVWQIWGHNFLANMENGLECL